MFVVWLQDGMTYEKIRWPMDDHTIRSISIGIKCTSKEVQEGVPKQLLELWYLVEKESCAKLDERNQRWLQKLSHMTQDMEDT